MELPSQNRRKAHSWLARNRFLLRTLVLPMTVFGIGALWWSWRVIGWWEGAFLEAGVTFLGVLLTTLYVESVVDRHAKSRWSPVSSIANRRLCEVATLLIDEIADHFPDRFRAAGFEIGYSQQRMNPGRYIWIHYDDPAWRSYIRDEVIPAAPQILDYMTDAHLTSLLDRLDYTEKKLQETISLFSAVLRPEQAVPIATLLDAIPTERDLIRYRVEKVPNRLPPGLNVLLILGLELIASSAFEVPVEWRAMAGQQQPKG